MANCFCCLSKYHGVPCSLPSIITTKVLKNCKTFSSRPRPRPKPNVQDQDQDQVFMIQDQDFHFCPRGASRPRPWSRGLQHWSFSQCRFFDYDMPPLCPGIGGGAQRKFGGHAKKNFPACAPQLQHRVGAYGRYDHVLAASTGGMSPEPPLRLSEQELLEYQPVPRFSGFAV